MTDHEHVWSHEVHSRLRYPGTKTDAGELHFKVCTDCGLISGHVTNVTASSGKIPFETTEPTGIETQAFAVLEAAGGL